MPIQRALAAALTITAFLVDRGWCRTWHVQPDGKGDARTIQAAMNLAKPGDDVLLSPGTYSWTAQGAIGESMVQIRPGVSLRSSGGAASTILDAELRGRGVMCQATGDVVISGLTIRNGRVTRERFDIYPLAAGGGILSDANSHPTISGCVIRENEVVGFDYMGAGVFCVYATIIDSHIEANRGSYQSRGGGIACSGQLFLIRSVVRGHLLVGDNIAEGAGVWAVYAVIDSCVFEANEVIGTYASRGGGAVLRGGRVSNSRFIRNSIVVDRGSTESPRGAAVHCNACSLTASVFVQNAATGGRFPGLGTVSAGDARPLSLDRCTFIGNRSLSLSGVPDDYDIAGVVADAAIVTSSIFAFNQGKPVYHSIETRCSNFSGNTGGDDARGVDGGGNFSLDPLFCFSDSSAVPSPWIQARSPCAPGRHPNNVDCGLIGAVAPGCPERPILQKTFGTLKEIFR